MSAAHIQLMVDLELRSDPITGSVGAGDAAPSSFRGWTELAALIEAHRASNGAPASDPRELRQDRPNS